VVHGSRGGCAVSFEWCGLKRNITATEIIFLTGVVDIGGFAIRTDLQ
jgi:hypothetical protein